MPTGMSRRRFVVASGLFAGCARAMEIDNYRRLGLERGFRDMPFDTEVNGRSNMEIMDALNVPEDTQYNPCPEASPGDDVPRGELLKFPAWSHSRVFPETRRDVWIYVPQQVSAGSEPALMVFGEGGHSLRHGGAIFADSLRWLSR